MKNDEIPDLIGRDQKEDAFGFGQRTRDTFEHADVFVAVKNMQYKKGIQKFLELVLSFPYATPGKDEYGMFLAYSASTRSGALARQVGAAILSIHGDLLAVGCNDVPAPGGGLYWENDINDFRGHKRREDPNELEKHQIIKSAVKIFKQSLAPGADTVSLIPVFENAVSSAISDITEFGRSVHAKWMQSQHLRDVVF